MDFSAYKSDTKQVKVTFTDADTGAALDITNGSAVLRLLLDGTVEVTKTNGTGQHSDPTNGETVFTLSALDLTRSPGVHTWDATLTLNGAIRTAVAGCFTILPK